MQKTKQFKSKMAKIILKNYLYLKNINTGNKLLFQKRFQGVGFNNYKFILIIK